MTEKRTSQHEKIIGKIAATKKTWRKPVINDLQLKDTFGSKTPSPVKEGDVYAVVSS